MSGREINWRTDYGRPIPRASPLLSFVIGAKSFNLRRHLGGQFRILGAGTKPD